MKTMKKINLAVIGIAGMLYSATPTSAQTFYQCFPCAPGTYANNGKCKDCLGFTETKGVAYCTGSKHFTPGTYTLTIPAGKWKATIQGGDGGSGYGIIVHPHGQAGGPGAVLVKIFTINQEERIQIKVGKKSCGGNWTSPGNAEGSSIELLTKSGGGVSGITRANKLIAGGGHGGASKVGSGDADVVQPAGKCEYSGLSLNSSIGEQCHYKGKKTGSQKISGTADGKCGFEDGKVTLEILEQ